MLQGLGSCWLHCLTQYHIVEGTFSLRHTCVTWCAHGSLGLAVLFIDRVPEVAQLYERVAPLL